MSGWRVAMAATSSCVLTLVSICTSRLVCDVTMAFVRFALTLASSPADALPAKAAVV